MQVHIGKRIIVMGVVVHLAVSGYSHRLFWEIPEGLAIASLSDDPDAARPQVACVFSGGLPEGIKVGKVCQIEGTYREVMPTSGVPLLVNCKKAR